MGRGVIPLSKGVKMNALEYAVSSLNATKKLAEVQLEIVEGDSNLADLQGFITGAKRVINTLDQVGYTLELAEHVLKIENYSDDEIIKFDFEIDAFKTEERWQDFQSKLDEKIAKKKDFLFYEARKGRDLAYIQGWRKAIFFIHEIFDLIQEKAKELKKAPTFEF